jgi:hypothetical protein
VRPVIFGYVHVLPTTSRRLVAHLRATLADYAERECFTLAEVFVERTDADRSALTALIEALDRREAVAVVVPALDHFSAVPSARQAIRRYIERETGARVLVMYPSE